MRFASSSHHNNNMSFREFDGEFASVKRYSPEEVKADALINRLKQEKNWKKLNHSATPKSAISLSPRVGVSMETPQTAQNRLSSNYKTSPNASDHTSNGKHRKRITLTGIDDLRKSIQLKQLLKTPAVTKRRHKSRIRLIPVSSTSESKPSGSFQSGLPASESGHNGRDSNQEEHNGNIQDKQSSEGSRDPSNPQSLDQTSDDKQADVYTMKRVIMSQLTGKLFPFLQQSSLKPTYDEIYTMLLHTIKDGEGHSTLLMGPRGSGKTLIIEQALASLRQNVQRPFIYIKLNALLHTDDKLALREIARQLDANLGTSTNSQETGARQDKADTGTFEQRAISDTFTNIMLALDSNGVDRTDKPIEVPTPIVFVIDEIDKFTSSNKQTLLYNLFDLTQSSQVPICVIGVSTKVTSRELFEKRVKSRFSQRIITTKSPQSMDEFKDNAKLALKVHECDIGRFKDRNYPLAWNSRIDELFCDSVKFKRPLFLLYHTTKSYQDFNTSCMVPVSRISVTSPFPNKDLFELYPSMQSSSYIQSVLNALSRTEALMLICAARWSYKSARSTVNFNLAYKEYVDTMKLVNIESTTLSSATSYIDSTVLAGIKISQRIWPQNIMRDSWANLYKYGLLFDAITSNSEVNANSNHNMYKLMVLEDSRTLQLDITLAEIGGLLKEDDSLKKLCTI